jgi:dipeptidyl aminopeptidase/acylaminoacyl peptidase
VRDTHKHELHYLDRLVAPFEGNETLYAERSPINFVSDFTAPLLVLQGEEDKVVPPNQSEFICRELARQGKPVAYVAFPGEFHGFSKPASNVRAANAELYFLGRVFGFTPAEPVEAIEILNL